MMRSLQRHQKARYTLMTVMILGFLAVLFPFYLPVILASTFALAFEPFIRRLLNKKWLGRRLIALTLILTFLALSAGGLSLLGYYVVSKTKEISQDGLEEHKRLLEALTVAKQGFVNYVNHLLSRFNVDFATDATKIFDRIMSSLQAFIGPKITQFFGSIPEKSVTLFVFCVALYFFVTVAPKIRERLLYYDVLPAADLDLMIKALQRSCHSAIISSCITGAAQALIVFIGSLIMQFGNPFLLFAISFFFSFVPVIGAASVPFTLTLICLIETLYGHAIGFGIVTVLSGTIDNVIRPLIASQAEKNTHPIVILVAILGGLQIFGLAGLFLGPAIATFTIRELPMLLKANRVTPIHRPSATVRPTAGEIYS